MSNTLNKKSDDEMCSFNCCYCDEEIQMAEKYAGMEIQCPKCNESFITPNIPKKMSIKNNHTTTSTISTTKDKEPKPDSLLLESLFKIMATLSIIVTVIALFCLCMGIINKDPNSTFSSIFLGIGSLFNIFFFLGLSELIKHYSKFCFDMIHKKN